MIIATLDAIVARIVQNNVRRISEKWPGIGNHIGHPPAPVLEYSSMEVSTRVYIFSSYLNYHKYKRNYIGRYSKYIPQYTPIGNENRFRFCVK
jgi:hypothetical protein